MKCELAIEPTDEKLKTMAAIQAYFLKEQKPSIFDPYDNDNILSGSENQFEDVCNTMEDQGSANPKQLTEFEFYHKLRFYEKKFKAQEHGTG